MSHKNRFNSQKIIFASFLVDTNFHIINVFCPIHFCHVVLFSNVLIQVQRCFVSSAQNHFATSIIVFTRTRTNNHYHLVEERGDECYI